MVLFVWILLNSPDNFRNLLDKPRSSFLPIFFNKLLRIFRKSFYDFFNSILQFWSTIISEDSFSELVADKIINNTK